MLVDLRGLHGRSDSPRGSIGRGSSRGRVDDREVLKPDEFEVFARLRQWRKEQAKGESVPVYTVFTNGQLARMVQSRVSSRADLAPIEGVGDARIEKYGAPVLEFLRRAWSSNGEPGRPTV